MTQQDRDEFISLRTDVEHIKVTVEKAEENSERLNKEFDKLMFHLVGDRNTDTKGMIQDFRDIKFRLSRVEKFYIVIAGIIGFAISGVTLWFKKII